MEKKESCVFGVLSLVLITSLNVLFTLPFFISMLVEQIRIGRGTDLEMGTIVILIGEVLALIPYVVAIVFTIISIRKHDYLKKIIINVVQIVLYLVLHTLAVIWIFI